MKKSEANELAVSLAKLFPGSGLNEEHAKSIREEFSKFEYEHVKAAIKEHHRTKEFISFPELYKMCEAPIAPAAPTRRNSGADMSFVEIVKQQWPALGNRSDHEVIIRFWRGDWIRYKFDADARLHSITEQMQNGDAKKRLTEAGYTSDQIATMQEKVLADHERNEDGYKTKVVTQCRGCLLNAKMDPESIEAWIDTLFSAPDHFRTCLAEIRGELPVFSGAP